MNRLFYSLIALLASCAVMVGCCVSLDEPQPPTPDEPQPPISEEAPFEVEIVEITRASLRFNVIPTNLDSEYLCIVEEKSVVDEFTKQEYLISTIYQDLEGEANAVGKTLTEYLPTLTDKGILEDAKFSGLAVDSDYYLIIIGVDPANNYAATDDVVKTPFHTLAAEATDCTFNVRTTVVTNNVTFTVEPSDKDHYWYLMTLSASDYDYYVTSEQGMQLSDYSLYTEFISRDINSLRGAGYSDEKIIATLFHKGDLELMASGLKANSDYLYLIAGLVIDADGILVSTPISSGGYTTGDAPISDMTFQIEVWDIGQLSASVRITPSNNNEKYCALIQPWDGVTDADTLMHQIVDQWGSWMEIMADDKGVVEHSGAKAFKLPAADTDYYVIAFGYNGGITTGAYMKTFRTLPGGDVEEAVFTMSGSNITPYGFNLSVTSSDPTIFYTMNICKPEDYNEAELIELENEVFDYYYTEYQKFNPVITIAEILDQYYYNGTTNLKASGLEPDTEYMGYVYALDVRTGHVVRAITFDVFAKTDTLGDITPTVEIVGYYSGDEENGTVFGNASAVAGKSITVVKYSNFDGARSLFSSMSEGDCSNVNSYSDSEIWQTMDGSWSSCKLTSPYTFYITEWNSPMTALAYATDNAGKMGGIGRLYTCATAENKGNIEDLRTLVNELNGKSSSSFMLPTSLVVSESQIVLTVEE